MRCSPDNARRLCAEWETHGGGMGTGRLLACGCLQQRPGGGKSPKASLAVVLMRCPGCGNGGIEVVPAWWVPRGCQAPALVHVGAVLGPAPPHRVWDRASLFIAQLSSGTDTAVAAAPFADANSGIAAGAV